jgi:hypothetical protein
MTFTSNLNAAQAETQQNNIMNSFIQYYIDNEINKLKQILVDAAPENLDNLHELGQAIQAETERALAAEGLLDQHIEDEEAARAVAVAAVQTALDAFIAAEATADAALDARLNTLETDPTTKTYVDTQDSALDTRITAIEDAPYATDAGVTIVANDLRTDFEAEDAALSGRLDTLESDPTTKTYVDTQDSALSGRLDTLEADPTTKTYVDAQDALALPKAGGLISVDSEANFRFNKTLVLDSTMETRIWSDGHIKLAAEEDYNIELSTMADGATKVSGTFLVNTNAKLSFSSNLTKIENVLRGTGINIGNNIEMNPAAAGGRVEINGDLILDASDLTDAADDTAAAAAGVVVGQVYHNSGALRVRLS